MTDRNSCDHQIIGANERACAGQCGSKNAVVLCRIVIERQRYEFTPQPGDQIQVCDSVRNGASFSTVSQLPEDDGTKSDVE